MAEYFVKPNDVENTTEWLYPVDLGAETRAIRLFFLCAVLVVIILATLIGNLMVIIAILVVPKLRRPENLLILNLAVADEMVATLVMPVALIQEAINYWPFGSVICNLFISLDITICSASILSLCVISLDRYFVISRPLHYGPKRTTRRMLMSVAGVWLLSMIISVPPLLFFDHKTTGRQCEVNQDWVYQVYATITAFYAPVILMLFAYWKIYGAARISVLVKLNASQTTSANFFGRTAEESLPISKKKIAEDEKHFMFIQPIRRASDKKSSVSNGMVTRMIVPGLTVTQPLLEKLPGKRPSCHRTNSTYYSRELKAFRTITAIAVAFLVSWLPFFILALIRPFNDGIPKWVSGLALWLGYFNSTINPVLYSIFNKDFRRPFAELLRCRCWSLRRTIRAETYEEQFGTCRQGSFRSLHVSHDSSQWTRYNCTTPERTTREVIV